MMSETPVCQELHASSLDSNDIRAWRSLAYRLEHGLTQAQTELKRTKASLSCAEENFHVTNQAYVKADARAVIAERELAQAQARCAELEKELAQYREPPKRHVQCAKHQGQPWLVTAFVEPCFAQVCPNCEQEAIK